MDGSWSPVQPNIPFSFPACGRVVNSTVSYRGSLRFDLICNDTKTRETFRRKLENVFEQIDKYKINGQKRKFDLICPFLTPYHRGKRDVDHGFEINFDLEKK